MRALGVAVITVATAACGRLGFDSLGAVADDEAEAPSQTYIKASNTDIDDEFSVVAVSHDGSTLAVGAYSENSAATGVDGNQSDNSVPSAGAVYVFVRSGDSWAQQAYLKASNTGNGLDVGDSFGWSLALSDDGSTLAVGAPLEDSNGDPADDSVSAAGAVYIFTRTGTTWLQTAYLKAGSPGLSDSFGESVAISADGTSLAVGAVLEASGATGINGNEDDNTAPDAGAAYVFVRVGTTWSQQAFIKPSNTNPGDEFASAVSLSASGDILAVGAVGESSATQGNPADNSLGYAGAAYVFERTGGLWAQTAYLKAPVPGAVDYFGSGLALSADGTVLAIGAPNEDSAATGIDGDATNESASASGAVYTFIRDGTVWTPQTYIKAPNTDTNDTFGGSVALAADGSALVVAAAWEDSAATGFDGNMFDRSAGAAGAAYLLRPTTDNSWQHATYIKAPNAYASHAFGRSVTLSADGGVLAIGARYEDSAATGVDGNQADHSAPAAGAAYVYW